MALDVFNTFYTVNKNITFIIHNNKLQSKKIYKLKFTNNKTET